jgi:hypothetical protein
MSRIFIKPQDWSKQFDMLRRLPDELADKVIEKALITANESALYAAQRAAVTPGGNNVVDRDERQLTGDLSESIAVKFKKLDNNYLWAGVGPSRPKGAHGHLVESGHRIGVGGTLVPLDPMKQAPIAKRGRWYTFEINAGKSSRGKKKLKALFAYLGKQGASVDNLMDSLAQWKTQGDDKTAPDLVKGALKTKGILKKVHGIRGMGTMRGYVMGHPFLEPVFESKQSEIDKVFRVAVENESRKVLGG